MSTCVFIQIRCKPGTTYKVAEDIALREIHSELYSTSGDFDLLMKLYIPLTKTWANTSTTICWTLTGSSGP